MREMNAIPWDGEEVRLVREKLTGNGEAAEAACLPGEAIWTPVRLRAIRRGMGLAMLAQAALVLLALLAG